MARPPGIRRLFRFPSSEDRVPSDVDREIAFHVEERTRELIARGVDAASAREAALREFGNVGEARRELTAIDRRRVRELRRSDWWSDLRQDVRYGVRALVKAPLFTGLAIVTLALGIGVNAAVFGVLKSVLLDALPYGDSDRLVRVYSRQVDSSQGRGPLSAGTVVAMRQRLQSFSTLTAFAGFPNDVVYGGAEGPRMARLAWVESGFFETLNVLPSLGRTFRDDDRASGLAPLSGGQLAPDTARGVVLTHAAWQRLFGADRGVIGRDVRIDGTPRTVIGVLPAGFAGPMGDADFFLAFDLAPVAAHPVVGRRSQWLGVIARLKPGMSEQAAEGEVAAVWTNLVREFPADNSSMGIVTMTLRDAMVGDTRTPLLVLMTSAGLVLAIACANLAGALLARTLTRRKEFAIRVAIGAGRGRLIRQLLTESTLLACAGGAAGLVLAAYALRVVRGLSLADLPPHVDLALDPGAILLTAALALATGLAFGTAPAIAIARAEPQRVLRDETRGGGESRHARHLRGVLVAGQIALSISLLAGAGLLTRSLWAMMRAPLGADSDRVLTATVQLPVRDYGTPESRAQFFEQFTERLRALPGATTVATATGIPTAVRSRGSFTIEGAPWADGREPFVLSVAVSDEYFRLLRIPLRQGRTFDSQDRPGTPPTVVVSESMARRYWPDGRAVGARIRMGPNRNAPVIEIVGVVGDVRNDLAQPDAEPIVYRASRRNTPGFATVLIRTDSDPLVLVKPVERELAALDSGLALQRAMTLEAVIAERLTGRRHPVMLMTAFGALALLLASVGVYAMFASAAAAREQEFGVRMALGSHPVAIAALLLRQGAAWMAMGAAGGAVGVVLVVRLLGDLLTGVPPFDPIALGLAVALLAGCAMIALLVPVRRATRVDPAIVLRTQ
jgi:putative ABC transport system permease protein